MIKRIEHRQDLRDLAKEIGISPDWHEPDEVEIGAVVNGTSFDNAGFWPNPKARLENGSDGIEEIHVVLHKGIEPIAVVNLATLFSWAASEYR